MGSFKSTMGGIDQYNVCSNSTAQVKFDRISSIFSVERGVKQGDAINPNLFNSV